MSLIPDECVEFDEKRKICIANENGKTYKLFNNSNYKIRKVKVDKCIKQKQRQKICDFLMEIEIITRVIFIELKGGDLDEALKQIYSSIMHLESEFQNYQIEVRIVGSRDTPGFINLPDYTKLAKKLAKSKGKIIRATNKLYEESI